MSADAARILAAALLAGLTACDGAATLPARSAQPAATVRPVAGGTAEAPEIRLAGKTVLSAAQAEAAVQLRLRTTVDLPGRQFYLVEAPGGGSACPMRYVVLAVAAGRTAATPPFGNCSSRATMTRSSDRILVSMPGFSNLGAPGTAEVFEFKDNRMTRTPVVPSAEPQATARRIVYAPSYRCDGTATGTAGADLLLAAFEREFPKALVDPAQVETQDIDSATLDRIVLDLACLAQLAGGDPFVPEQAAALFASRRYGKPALAVLDAQAQSGSAAAGSFAKQMRAYTDLP